MKLGATVIATVAALAAVRAQSQVECIDNSPYDSIKDNEDFSLLVAALQYTGLDGPIGQGFSGTIFAPTNQAFQQLLVNLDVDKLTDLSPELVADVLQQHVSTQTIRAENLQDEQVIPTLLSSSPPEECADGLELVYLADEGPNGAVKPAENPDGYQGSIIAGNVQVCSAIVHTINTVLVPNCPDLFADALVADAPEEKQAEAAAAADNIDIAPTPGATKDLPDDTFALPPAPTPTPEASEGPDAGPGDEAGTRDISGFGPATGPDAAPGLGPDGAAGPEGAAGPDGPTDSGAGGLRNAGGRNSGKGGNNVGAASADGPEAATREAGLGFAPDGAPQPGTEDIGGPAPGPDDEVVCLSPADLTELAELEGFGTNDDGTPCIEDLAAAGASLAESDTFKEKLNGVVINDVIGENADALQSADGTIFAPLVGTDGLEITEDIALQHVTLSVLDEAPTEEFTSLGGTCEAPTVVDCDVKMISTCEASENQINVYLISEPLTCEKEGGSISRVAFTVGTVALGAIVSLFL